MRKEWLEDISDYFILADIVQGPYNVFMLLAGYDEGEGPSLYFMDYLATMHKMNTAGHGYGGMFTKSLVRIREEARLRLVCGSLTLSVFLCICRHLRPKLVNLSLSLSPLSLSYKRTYMYANRSPTFVSYQYILLPA